MIEQSSGQAGRILLLGHEASRSGEPTVLYEDVAACHIHRDLLHRILREVVSRILFYTLGPERKRW